MKNSNFKKFLLLWTGELVSSIGGGLTSFGLGVNVFNQTGSAGAMALVTLLAFLPTLLLSAPAGVLADRLSVAMNTGVGRGAALVVMISGALLSVTAIVLYQIRAVRGLE